MVPVSCVSCVSWMYCVNAAETHETFHQESGMRYHAHTNQWLHEAQVVCKVVTIGDYLRGFAAAKTAIEPIVSSSTCSNDAPRISPSHSELSPRLSKRPRRLLASSIFRDVTSGAFRPRSLQDGGRPMPPPARA